MARVPTNRKSGFIMRSGAMRRESLWVALIGTSTALAPVTPVLFTGYSASILALRPFTVVRTRGVMSVLSDQSSATESFHAAMGMAIVSDEALAVGVTAVPTPISSQDSDLFFVYEALIGRLQNASNVGFDGAGGQFKTFDSKAMRKVEDGQDIAVSIESDTSPFLGCIVLKAGRQLIKLH